MAFVKERIPWNKGLHRAPFVVETPQVGQTRTKYYPKGHSRIQIWDECPECKIGRWQDSKSRINRLCHKCAMRHISENCRGDKSHAWRGGQFQDTAGYIRIYYPDHPYATHPSKSPEGYVLKHRLVMEKKLGRYLLPSEKVHHIDGIKNNNNEANLQLVSLADHQIFTLLCAQCPLRKEVKLLRWELKQAKKTLQLKLEQKL